MKIELNKVYNCDCIELMQKLPDNIVDLTVTSPPYDNLRTYNGNIEQWNFYKFKTIAKELYRITKSGGVVVWVVADATINGSETGTSFRQALFFKEIGFNIHDTMIYAKENYVPLTHNRYEQEFEYMFVLSKGKPKTFNPIKIPCKYAGTDSWGECGYHKTNSSGIIKIGKKTISDYKIKGNIFYYRIGSTNHTGISHPAPFPYELAKDHILSWSNENDIIFDPFMGSFTTAVACHKLNRRFIGAELDKEYYELGSKRLAEAQNQISLFDLT